MLLTKLMSQLGRVWVVAPDGPRSSMSNAMTMTKAMSLDRVDLAACDYFTPEEKARINVFVTNGYPADCVKLAVNVIFEDHPERIDLMVSGINHGSNASINVVYSGTMGACFAGCEHDIRAIGFSINDHSLETDLSLFEPYILELTRHLLEQPWHRGLSYNINAPVGEIKGIKWTRQAKGHWEKEIDTRISPDGKEEYWIAGQFVNEEPEATDTDQWAMDNGYISVHPCNVDMTDYAAL